MALGQTLEARSKCKYFLRLHKFVVFVCYIVVAQLASTSADATVPSECKPAGFPRSGEKWYCYDKTAKECQQVEMKSQDSGKICFPGLEMCIWRCITPKVCSLKKHNGDQSCLGAKPQLMYYFDEHKQSCELFLYKGCNGNKNNFQTLHECEVTCKGLPCVTLTYDPDYCVERLTMDFFYYNTVSGTCMKHGICNRDGSNYKTLKDCKRRCILKRDATSN
uniref:Putative bilaris n=1 Tax=Rhipicephalus pulchellus TaxID=72859 RepID=L7LSN3_RHIPC